jgi:hypothetical protein
LLCGVSNLSRSCWLQSRNGLRSCLTASALRMRWLCSTRRRRSD